MPTPRIAILISGGGRTMVNLADVIKRRELRAEIGLVIASRVCAGCDRAADLGLPCHVIKGQIPAATLEQTLRDHRIDYVVLAGYLKKLNVPPSYRGKIVNIHPALLPAFGGPGMYGHHVHQAVIDHGCRVSGCTVHLVDDQYDTGAILVQRACCVMEDDTADTLAARVFVQELLAYPQALRSLLAGRVELSADGKRATIKPEPGSHPQPEGSSI
jgi:phosphoribosylglycinamide formyltransferase 1